MPRRADRRGLAGYWHAKPVRALSRRGLRADAVTRELQPYVWGVNADWFFEPEPYDFVLVAGLDQEAIRRRLGPPRLVERCGITEVWIYDRVADAPRFRFLRPAAVKRVEARGLRIREAWRENDEPG